MWHIICVVYLFLCVRLVFKKGKIFLLKIVRLLLWFLWREYVLKLKDFIFSEILRKFTAKRGTKHFFSEHFNNVSYLFVKSLWMKGELSCHDHSQTLTNMLNKSFIFWKSFYGNSEEFSENLRALLFKWFLKLFLLWTTTQHP